MLLALGDDAAVFQSVPELARQNDSTLVVQCVLVLPKKHASPFPSVVRHLPRGPTLPPLAPLVNYFSPIPPSADTNGPIDPHIDRESEREPDVKRRSGPVEVGRVTTDQGVTEPVTWDARKSPYPEPAPATNDGCDSST